MFKAFWNWCRGVPNALPVPTNAEEALGNAVRVHNVKRIEDDDKPDAPPLPDRVNAVMERLGKLMPVARPQPGVALDSYDDDMGISSADGSGTNTMKRAYNNDTPNISGAVVGFFLRQSFIGHQLAGLLAQHWLIEKCCSLPARDAIRHGFDIHTADGESIDAPKVLVLMKRFDKRYKLNKNMQEWLYKGKIFGIRILIYKVRSTDPLYYEYPFNLDAVGPGDYEGMVQVDPYWCSPELDQRSSSEPDSMHFFEPTYWQINGKRYHRSHLAIYREGDVVDVLKPAYLYGGIPVPQKIMERVYASERTANEAPNLAMSKRTTAVNTDLDGMVLNPARMQKFQDYSDLQNNFGLLLVDVEDKVTQMDTSLADFDSLTMTQYQLVASAACVPATKLLGTQPKGFSATGEFDEASYHEELESIQSGQLTEMVEKHHELVMVSCVVPAMRRIEDPSFEPFSTSIVWAPLDSPTALEYADIALKQAQTGAALMQTGAIDGYDERDRIRTDKNSGYMGIPEALRPDEDGDGEPDAPKIGVPAAPPTTGGFAGDAEDVRLITNQVYLDPLLVQEKQALKDYDVFVTPALPDPDTGRIYRVIIDGHHSLEAARIDGVPPNLIEGEYAGSDYFTADDGMPL